MVPRVMNILGLTPPKFRDGSARVAGVGCADPLVHWLQDSRTTTSATRSPPVGGHQGQPIAEARMRHYPHGVELRIVVAGELASANSNARNEDLRELGF
jgi:hypothetical protein